MLLSLQQQQQLGVAAVLAGTLQLRGSSKGQQHTPLLQQAMMGQDQMVVLLGVVAAGTALAGVACCQAAAGAVCLQQAGPSQASLLGPLVAQHQAVQRCWHSCGSAKPT